MNSIIIFSNSIVCVGVISPLVKSLSSHIEVKSIYCSKLFILLLFVIQLYYPSDIVFTMYIVLVSLFWAKREHIYINYGKRKTFKLWKT